MLDLDATLAALSELSARFAKEEQALNALDAAVGDGDHGSTMLRGMRAGEAAVLGGAAQTPGAAFVLMANAFQKATGGAGGTLFSSIFRGIGDAAGDVEAIDDATLGVGLGKAAATVARLGRVRVGGKTMLDALAPAAAALEAGGTAADAVEAARAGCEATRDMRASQGRARFVSEGGLGHVDPGARSVVIITETLARAFG